VLAKPVNPSLLFDAIMESFGHATAGVSSTGRRREGFHMDALRPVQGARRLVVEDNLINQQVPSELLVGFYQDHGEDIAAIREALSRGEENVAQRLAHTIKGVAATIGAADMTLRAKDLEAAIKGGQEAGCSELVEQLELAMQPVLQGLSAQLVQQVSGFEFDDALTTLANIRHSLETDR
jgi:HPt (histidine-containing phosphotransfer) domain-containing protein